MAPPTRRIAITASAVESDERRRRATGLRDVGTSIRSLDSTMHQSPEHARAYRASWRPRRSRAASSNGVSSAARRMRPLSGAAARADVTDGVEASGRQGIFGCYSGTIHSIIVPLGSRRETVQEPPRLVARSEMFRRPSTSARSGVHPYAVVEKRELERSALDVDDGFHTCRVGVTCGV